MRIGVRLGPVWVSTSTHSRRRRRSTQPKWHAKGQATTPDGREVDFRCHHNHRSQGAAINCAATIRKQIERGQNLHLITRVRSTPASREAARQRALQQEARRQAKAAQRAQAAQQRAQQKDARRQAKAAQHAQAAQQRAQQKEALAVQRQQQTAEQDARRAQGAQQRAERREEASLQRAARKEEAAQQRAEQWAKLHQRNDERWERVRQRNDERWERVRQRRAERSQQRRPRGWPITGLMIAGAAALLGVILAGVAGNNPHSALAATAGGLITLGILAALVCATAALWRRLRRGRRDQPRQPIPFSQNAPAAPYPAPPVDSPTNYTAGPDPGRAAVEQPPHTTPPRPYGEGAPWPPYGDGSPWPR